MHYYRYHVNCYVLSNMNEFQEYITRFENALLSVDKVASRQVYQELRKMISPVEFVDRLIVPALERIGLGWERGGVSLSQVYMSGRLCEDMMDTIIVSRSSSQQFQAPVAIAVLEDYHVLGKRIVCSVLRSCQIDILDFGHGIKVEDLCHKVKEKEIKILLISTLMLRSALLVKQLKERLDGSGNDTRIVVGGAPFLFDDQLWKIVGADAFCRNASDAISTVNALQNTL